MKRINLLVKNSLFVNWLLSYTSILLIPLLINGVIFYFADNLIQNETNRANSALLIQLQQTIDTKIKEIEQISIKIAFNQRVNTASSIKGHFKASDQFNLLKLKQDLSLYKNTSDILDYIYIYFYNSDSIIGIDMNLDSKLYYSIEKNEIILDYPEWKEMMRKPHHKEYTVFKSGSAGQETGRSIVYLQSLPMLYSANYDATLVQMINEDTLLGIIEDIQWVNKGNVVILDNEDRIITYTQSVDLTNSLAYKNLIKDQDIISTTISGKKYVVSYVTSNINNWKYILLMPTNVFWEKVDFIRNLIFISILLCIILGGIVAYIFTKRDYVPIQKIVQSLDKKDIMSFESKYTEYGLIRKAFYDTLTEKDKIAKTLEKKDDILNNSRLVRFMITNSDSITQVREILSSYGINPDDRYFSVVVFYINQSYIPSPPKECGNMNDMEINHFIISNVVTEMVNNVFWGLMVDVGDKLACIISFGNENKCDYNREIYRIITEAKQFINSNFDLNFTASVGSLHMGIKGIGKSYREAVDAYDARLFIGREGIVLYDDISNLNVSYYYTENTEHRLTNLIETGDYDNAYILLQEIFNLSFESESFSVEIVKCLMFDIVGSFIKVSDAIGDVNFVEEMEPFKRLMACTSVTGMKEELALMLKSLCDYVKQHIKETNCDLSSKVIEYITSHYQDVNLNIPMIAEHFGITPAYLSRLFKIQTKEKLLDKINKIRIEKSKQLLKEGKENIKRISELVGYSNSSVFIRSFKKYEGITPGQYNEKL